MMPKRALSSLANSMDGVRPAASRSRAAWALPLVAITSFSISIAQARLISADSQRGEKLFQTEGCIQCHSIRGQGGAVAPDLGKLVARNYSPALMASVMWNHAPTMWATMSRRGVHPIRLDEQEAADLFGYFYSVRLFDKLG